LVIFFFSLKGHGFFFLLIFYMLHYFPPLKVLNIEKQINNKYSLQQLSAISGFIDSQFLSSIDGN